MPCNKHACGSELSVHCVSSIRRRQGPVLGRASQKTPRRSRLSCRASSSTATCPCRVLSPRLSVQRMARPLGCDCVSTSMPQGAMRQGAPSAERQDRNRYAIAAKNTHRLLPCRLRRNINSRPSNVLRCVSLHTNANTRPSTHIDLYMYLSIIAPRSHMIPFYLPISTPTKPPYPCTQQGRHD